MASGASIAERLRPLAETAREGVPTLVVYGPGVRDLFIDGAGHRAHLEPALHDALERAGFERVTFFSLTNMLTVYSDGSRLPDPRGPRASEREPGQGTAAAEAPRVKRRVKGPLGDYRVRPEPRSEAVEQPRTSAMTDENAVRMLIALMADSPVRTAIVLDRVELLESHLTPESLRDLATAIDRWQRPGDGNLCVLVFGEEDLTRVEDWARSTRNLPGLITTAVRQERNRPRTPGLIGPPAESELTALVHRVRLLRGLRVDDWRGLRLAVRLMFRSRLPLHVWASRLDVLVEEKAAISQAELRARGWVTGPELPLGDVWQQLGRLKGLDQVRKHLENLRYQPPAGPEAVSRHMVFLGNPGTGKTTVARLVGDILLELGLLRSGHVIEASAADLVAEHEGGTTIKTGRLIDRALDGVLFVDEAYMLSDQREGFGKEAIDTLLARMENDRDRLVVIIAGYPAQTMRFLRSNPGLRSRFPDSGVLEFPDYDPATLLSIALKGFGELGLAPDADFGPALEGVVNRMYRERDENFGNARVMRDLVAETAARWAQRVREDRSLPLAVADLPERLRLPQGEPSVDELLGPINEMVGLEAVKRSVLSLVRRLQHERRRGAADLAAPHMLFVGAPGTGKTEVAREIGRILRGLGLLPRGHLVEVGRSQLVAGYVGQTAIATRERIQEALGGVLFVDEAYSLTRGGGNGHDFGREAVDTLVQEMENRRGRLVVIAAGYPEEMDEFLRSNTGLASRFGQRIEFPSYDTPALVEILRRKAAERGYVIPDEVAERAARRLDRARQEAGFGNGRTVRLLLEAMVDAMAERTANDPGADLNTFVLEDVPE